MTAVASGPPADQCCVGGHKGRRVRSAPVPIRFAVDALTARRGCRSSTSNRSAGRLRNRNLRRRRRRRRHKDGCHTAPAAIAARLYQNCAAAHQDGRWDIPEGDADYWSAGDRDGDGIAHLRQQLRQSRRRPPINKRTLAL
ncbi:excalibur calcium-binding domain-containing protein [Mycolicibacterium sediminis]|uniref:excalibur calcium-binding domain-containing protein n=1 Tax=Mycolicibacterium sediminis TaxID=1286180 RepID=UPI0013D7B73C